VQKESIGTIFGAKGYIVIIYENSNNW
jgi:hypothetical protein